MDKRKISATVIADSINRDGKRNTSMVLVFPRIVLAELNTHRVFTRNSASSRAIPFKKMLESVMQDPFIPIKWMKDHSGMQGTEYFTEEEALEYDLLGKHLFARDCAVACAKSQAFLTKLPDGKWLGLTKQIINRYLEPFLWHTVIVTATEWENFFSLRANEAAEIHIQELAYRILEAYNNSTPRKVDYGEWHIPFEDNIDTLRIQEDFRVTSYGELEDYKLKIATARCARVSYTNFEGKDDYKADVELFDRLASMGHYSPFEHCAMAVEPSEPNTGNFRGFKQYRQFLPNENRIDNRVIKKTWEDGN